VSEKELLEKSLDQAARCIKFVRGEHLHNQTPCTDWDLQALLNHLVAEILWIPDMAAGKTIAQVGNKYEGDVLRGDAVQALTDASKAAMAAISSRMADIAHLSYADVPMAAYLKEIAADVVIHTWDVAQGLHSTLLLDDGIVAAVYKNTLPRLDEYAASGLFAAPVSVSDDADLQTKLLGLVGRRPFTEPAAA
jgi:uncharacterized protein (TIGR03086 family)